MSEAFETKEKQGTKPSEPSEHSKLQLEGGGVPPRQSNETLTNQRFGELALNDGGPKTKEEPDKSSPSDDLQTKKDICSGLRYIFGITEISGDENQDGKLTKEELSNLKSENEPYKSLEKTLINNFDKLAPEGFLTTDMAKKIQRRLNAEIDTAEEPARIEQEKKAQARTKELTQEAEQIKKFIQENGQDPTKTVSEALKNNSVTFLASPALAVTTEIFKSAPPDSRLALTEMPSALRPLFDTFNRGLKDSDFSIPNSLPEKMGGQAALDSLNEYFQVNPTAMQSFKELRNNGVKIFPVGDNKSTPYGDLQGDGAKDEQAREETIKNNILSLLAENKDKPILALGYNLHGARAYEGVNSFKSASYLLNHDATFKAGHGKVVTFNTAVANPDNIQDNFPVSPNSMSKTISKSTCVQTRLKDQSTGAGKLRQGDNDAFHLGTGAFSADAWDYLILHPPRK